MPMIRLLAALAAIVFACPVLAAPVLPPPVVTTLPAPAPAPAIDPRCGTVIVLTGELGAYKLPAIRCAEPARATIDATAATFTEVSARGIEGVDWIGGRIAGTGTAAFALDKVARVSVRNVTMSGTMFGLQVSRSREVDLVGNLTLGMRSDGVSLNQVQGARVVGNTCINFRPVLAIYDAAGKLVRDGSHPDCVQALTSDADAPSGDIVVSDWWARGYMQGAWFGNPPYGEITVTHGRYTGSAWTAIGISGQTQVNVHDNTVNTEPGARTLYAPFGPVISRIALPRSIGPACDNVGAVFPGSERALAECGR